MQPIPISIAAALAIAFVAPTFKQDQSLTMKDLVAQSGNMPATIKLADLTTDYKAMKLKVSGSSDGLMGLGPFAMIGMMGPSGGNNAAAGLMLFGMMDASWTKANTIKLNGYEYLVTYKPEIAAAPGSGKGAFTLRLNLVRTDMISSVEPLPDLTKDDLDAAFRAAGMVEYDKSEAITPIAAQNGSAETVAVSNARQIALGMIMYENDFDDLAPYAQSTATVRSVIYPYLKTKEVWKTMNPNNSEFLFNMSLAGVEMSEIPSPAETPLFYESKPWPNGTRVIAYADGHVKRMPEQQWPAIEKLLHLNLKRKAKPLPPGYLPGGG